MSTVTAEEWMNKLQCIHTIGYHKDVNNELKKKTKLISLGDIILREEKKSKNTT